MDDPKKEELAAELQKTQEPLEVIDSLSKNTKNQPLKIKIKFPTKNGFCREAVVEETHVQHKDQTLIELKNHLPSSSMEEEEETHVQQKDQTTVELKNQTTVELKNHLPSSSMEEEEESQQNKISKCFPCSVCLKIFPSKKSLYGHMRLHSMMLKIDYQRQNSMMRWPVTGKRGRKSKQQLERDISEAADALLMLPNGNSLDLADKDYIQRTRVSEEDTFMAVDHEKVLEKKPRIEEAEQCNKAKTDKEIENSRPTWLLYGVPSNGMMPFKSEMMLMNKFCKSGKIETPMSCPEGGFSCDKCGKSFPSHQALGGHKSGHRNDKNRIHNAGSENLSLHGESLEFKPCMSKNNVRTHQCKICNATFESGQALGGHQRLHRPKASPTCSDSSPDKKTKESSITSASSPERFLKEPSISSEAPLMLEQVSCKAVHNRVEFDLNELPPDNEYCF